MRDLQDRQRRRSDDSDYDEARVSLLGRAATCVRNVDACTDLPAYSDTVYRDTPLTVTLLACPK